MDENEMSAIINDAYWEAAKRLTEDPQGTYQGPWSDKAARAIAEGMRAGVVWESAGQVEILTKENDGIDGTYIPLDDGDGGLDFYKVVAPDGQRVRVTVRLEGEDADKGMG